MNTLSLFTRWLWFASSVFVLTVLGGYTFTALQPKVYVATAQIQIRPPTESQLDGNNMSDIFTMQSADILRPIIKDFALDRKWAKRIYKTDQPALRDDDALAYLKHNSQLEPVRGTHIICIVISSDLPQEAAEIANAIADRYKNMREMEEKQHYAHRDDSLANHIAPQEKVVAEKLTVLSESAPTESPIRIISRADPPTTPVKPNMRHDHLLSVLTGLILGPLVATCLEVVLWLRRRPGRRLLRSGTAR